MSFKLKALGLGLLAALAVSSVAVVNAGATAGGHFTSEPATAHTILDITEVPPAHTVTLHAFGNGITCHHKTYSSTTTAATQTSITVTPSFTNCTDGEGRQIHVNMNGCTYTLTSGGAATHGTVHLVCPGSGPIITVTGPFGECQIEITPNQTPTEGVTYTTQGTAGTGHWLTADVTATNIHATIIKGKHNFFICATTATTDSSATLQGSLTIKGKDTAGNPVGVTAT